MLIYREAGSYDSVVTGIILWSTSSPQEDQRQFIDLFPHCHTDLILLFQEHLKWSPFFWHLLFRSNPLLTFLVCFVPLFVYSTDIKCSQPPTFSFIGISSTLCCYSQRGWHDSAQLSPLWQCGCATPNKSLGCHAIHDHNNGSWNHHLVLSRSSCFICLTFTTLSQYKFIVSKCNDSIWNEVFWCH